MAYWRLSNLFNILQVTKLKIDYNPFAKGFRKCDKNSIKPIEISSKESHTPAIGRSIQGDTGEQDLENERKKRMKLEKDALQPVRNINSAQRTCELSNMTSDNFTKSSQDHEDQLNPYIIKPIPYYFPQPPSMMSSIMLGLDHYHKFIMDTLQSQSSLYHPPSGVGSFLPNYQVPKQQSEAVNLSNSSNANAFQTMVLERK